GDHVAAHVVVETGQPQAGAFAGDVALAQAAVDAAASAGDIDDEVIGDDVEALRAALGDDAGPGPVVQHVILDEAVVAAVDVDAPAEGHRVQRTEDGVALERVLVAIGGGRVRAARAG